MNVGLVIDSMGFSVDVLALNEAGTDERDHIQLGAGDEIVFLGLAMMFFMRQTAWL